MRLNRFTEEAKENRYTLHDYNIVTEVPGDEEDMQQYANNKLGRHEDIEEELGIDFDILFMALRNGIYTIEDGYIPSDFLLLKYNKKFSRLVDNRPSAIAGGTCFYLQGYGTLWALTKEELE